MKHLLLATVAFVGLSYQAEAAVIQSQTLPAGPYTSPAPTSSVDTTTGLTGSVSGVYRSPFDTIPGLDTTGKFTAVEGAGTATFDVTGNQVSLIWGSPDTYNLLKLYSGADGTGSLLATISGGSVMPGNGTGFSFVTINGFGTFGSIILNNQGTPGAGSNAFELSTLTVSSVPLPASLPLFGGGLLALAALGYAKRNRAAKAAG